MSTQVEETNTKTEVWARPPIGELCVITFVDRRSPQSIAKKLSTANKNQMTDPNWIEDELLIRSVTMLAEWNGEFDQNSLVLKDYGSVSGTNPARQAENIKQITDNVQKIEPKIRLLRQAAIKTINLIK